MRLVKKYETRSVTAKARDETKEKELVVEDELILKGESTENQSKNDKQILYELSNFDTTIWVRNFQNINELPTVDLNNDEIPTSNNYNKLMKNNRVMLWLVRFGHASVAYLKALQLKFAENKELNEAIFDDSIKDCEVCLISKFYRLPFNMTRRLATSPLQIVHSDVIEPISPASHPKRYRYISIFVNDFSRIAMAYPMKTKRATGHCLEMFVRSARNLLGHDAKMCYLRTDQGTEFTGGETIEVRKFVGLGPFGWSLGLQDPTQIEQYDCFS